MDNMIFEKDFSWRVCDCDNEDVARFSSIWGLFQEAATLHAEHLGIGADDMHRNDRFWVLARMKVTVHRYPKRDEAVRVVTKASGSVKLYAVRLYEMYDDKNEKIAEGVSFWVVLERGTLRMLRGKEMPELFAGAYEGEMLGKIPAGGSDEIIENIIVHTSDLDVNDHVNNTNYIVWAEDIVRQSGERFYCAEVNYIAQVRKGEKLSATMDGDIVELAGEDGKPVFRAKINGELRA